MCHGYLNIINAALTVYGYNAHAVYEVLWLVK